jgi:hypothetical protein
VVTDEQHPAAGFDLAEVMASRVRMWAIPASSITDSEFRTGVVNPWLPAVEQPMQRPRRQIRARPAPTPPEPMA